MKVKSESYEFDWEKINHDSPNGMRIDIIAKKIKDKYFPMKGKGIIFMSEDMGNHNGVEQGHHNWGFIEIQDQDCLEMAQMGLELIQKAISMNDDIQEEIKKEMKIK